MAEITNPAHALETMHACPCPFRVWVHARDAPPNTSRPRLLFDPVVAAEPPAETMLRDLQEMVVSGETVLLHCADERRRDYAVFVVRKMGLRAGVPAATPVTMH